jgi:hypothetical protein
MMVGTMKSSPNSIRESAVRAIVVACLLSITTAASAAELYVAPNGNDANPGTAEQPFATLTKARNAIRALKAKGPLAEPVRVNVADGTYAVTEPLVLEPQDSGTKDAPVTYQAVPGAKPVFTGGRVLTGWQPGENGLWVTRVPEVAAREWYFEQLFVNGRRATRARTPNDKSYFFMQDIREEVLGKPVKPGKGRAKEARQTVRMRQADFEQAFGKLRSEDLRGVNLVVYHNWDNTRRFLDSIDPKQAKFVTSGEGMKHWNPWRRNAHFHLENYFAALDAPGEWFLARDGRLSYLPLPGEDMTKATVVAPVAEKFLVFQGDPGAGKLVEHLVIKGLTFQHGQWLTPPGGFEPAQAAAPIEAVVMADGARNVTIEDCEIGHVGIYCVWFRKGCRNCTLRRSHLHDFGAGGVRIGEAGIAAKEEERTGQITVDNNIIRHGGYIFPCAVGVWIGHSPDNAVTHNEIADLYYTGISAGWRWGYAESLAKRNNISFNHVHHIGWGLLSDMGGIYTLGPSEGTVVRNNVFHDIYAYSYGGWGMYTDEGSTGILFENNLTYRTKTGGFHQHYGKDNILRNNILAFSKLHQLQATRVEKHLSFTFEKNIIYWDTGKLLSGPWDKVQHISGNNCYWDTRGEPVKFLNDSLDAWQSKGHEQGSVVADPKFANPAAGDFHLAADSPALKLGFQPFDYTQAGVYGDPAWKAKAADATYPPLEIIPDPPALEIEDDFETTAVGQRPSGVETHIEGKGDSIAVSDEAAASGKRSVKIADAPGLSQGYNPHMVYGGVNYASGPVLNTFDLRVDAGAIVEFEWRDYSEGDYKTGARFTVRDGRLQLGEGRTVALPVGQWVKFELAATLGKPGWALRVTAPGQSPRVFRNLPYIRPEFKKLTWVGFMSTATVKTAIYLDNFTLSNRQPAGK